jgi:hypothetical protein
VPAEIKPKQILYKAVYMYTQKCKCAENPETLDVMIIMEYHLG